jgi:hypothetical protein
VLHLNGIETGGEARVGEQRSGGGRKVQRTWLWAAAASPGLASMGEGGMWCDWGRRERLASHPTAARLGPRTSGASNVLLLRERRRRLDNRQQRAGEREGAVEGGTPGTAVREECGAANLWKLVEIIVKIGTVKK